MADNKYSNLSELYEVSPVALQKADITLAALLNGYMLKRGNLGSDRTDMFFKMEKGKKLKTFAISVGENELSKTSEAVLNIHLGTDINEIDSNYYSYMINNYDKQTIDLFIDTIKASLIENNDRDNANLKNFYSDRIKFIQEKNNSRQSATSSEKI